MRRVPDLPGGRRLAPAIGQRGVDMSTIRWASVGGLVRKAEAIASAVRPQTSRRVSATWASGASAGWQQVISRR
jgi:hypothetical protein